MAYTPPESAVFDLKIGDVYDITSNGAGLSYTIPGGFSYTSASYMGAGVGWSGVLKGEFDYNIPELKSNSRLDLKIVTSMPPYAEFMNFGIPITSVPVDKRAAVEAWLGLLTYHTDCYAGQGVYIANFSEYADISAYELDTHFREFMLVTEYEGARPLTFDILLRSDQFIMEPAISWSNKVRTTEETP